MGPKKPANGLTEWLMGGRDGSLELTLANILTHIQTLHAAQLLLSIFEAIRLDIPDNNICSLFSESFRHAKTNSAAAASYKSCF